MKTVETTRKLSVRCQKKLRNKHWTFCEETFTFQSEATNYALSVGNYTGGNYVDVLTNLNGRPFSTFDFDNDDWFVFSL